MELQLGGPVWHASGRARTRALAWRLATSALNGVGDASLGEWHEEGERAVHLRRRLTDTERELAGGLTVRDIRGSAEERARLAALVSEAPQLLPYLPLIGGAT